MEKQDKRSEKRSDKKEDNKSLIKERRDMVHFDYKNVELLSEYINPHARILNRRRTNLTARDQRCLAEAIKRARTMALMPYITR
jgi:small subunit ribosomal protein S18